LGEIVADRSSIDITGRRLLGSIPLLKAPGGGWKIPESPTEA